jgi:hypothetical protein
MTSVLVTSGFRVMGVKLYDGAGARGPEPEISMASGSGRWSFRLWDAVRAGVEPHISNPCALLRRADYDAVRVSDTGHQERLKAKG